jgi:hypothetical protein
MNFRRRLAVGLRALAERLDPPPASPSPLKLDGETDTEFARRMADDMILRDALHRALRRYSPREDPGQA